MECVDNDDRRTHWPICIFLHGLLQRTCNIDVTTAVAFGPIHDRSHISRIGDPMRCDPATAHALIVVATVEGELHFQAGARCGFEHLPLQRLRALPTRAATMV